MHILDLEWKQIVDYLYPRRCPACEDISPQGFCDACRKKIPLISRDYCMKCGKPVWNGQAEYCTDCSRRRHFFQQGRSLFSYQGEIRMSLARMKYDNKREYADVYGDMMAEYLGDWIRGKQIDVIVPVPLHSSRKRERGYNQAALVARRLGTRMQIPVEEKILLRKRKTLRQKELTDRERFANLHGAFSIGYGLEGGEHILIVDDIYTTGSTVDAAASVLQRAGAGAIYIITIAIGG